MQTISKIRKYITVHSQRIHSPSKHHQQIPITIERRLSNHSSNETVCRYAAQDYEKALEKLGFNVKLQYKPTNKNASNKINCKRNTIWFNPPFSKTASTKIGYHFFNLLGKHFPKYHKFASIFKRNNVKFSYNYNKN